MTRGGKTTITLIKRIIKIRLKLKEKPNEMNRIITYVHLTHLTKEQIDRLDFSLNITPTYSNIACSNGGHQA